MTFDWAKPNTDGKLNELKKWTMFPYNSLNFMFSCMVIANRNNNTITNKSGGMELSEWKI
jgi:hypothetical protein